MILLIDTSLWIAFTRSRNPARLKQFIAPYVLEAQFNTLPCLGTPTDLWQRAIVLGQACREIGRTVPSLDLLVAAVALPHNAELVSFDADFEAIASVSVLRLTRLNRPV
jgi:predicted nucleic acid-binding protein